MGLIEWFKNGLNAVGAAGIKFFCIVLILIGIAVLIGVPVLAVQIPLLKAIPIAAGTFGGALGMFFIMAGYYKIRYMGYIPKDPNNKGIVKIVEGGIQDKIKTEELTKEVEKLKKEKIDLAADNERLQAMKGHIENIYPQLKLELLNIEVSKPDIIIDKMISDDKSKVKFLGLIPTSTTSYEAYRGIVVWNYTATYGINLMKLKFYEADKKIYVTGIEPENFGSINPIPEKQIFQKRQISVDKKGKKTAMTIMEEYSDGLAAQMEEFLKKKEENTHIPDAISKSITEAAQRFIRTILAPFAYDRKKEIEFTDDKNLSNPYDLPSFFDKAITDNTEKIRFIEAVLSKKEAS